MQPPEFGVVVEIAEVGGLHHRYDRRAEVTLLSGLGCNG
jgi:hypothetical protein